MELAMTHTCDNCGWTGPEERLDEIDDFMERVQPGADDIVPSGQCPECGCLTFLEPSRWVNRVEFDAVLDQLDIAYEFLLNEQDRDETDDEDDRRINEVLRTLVQYGRRLGDGRPAARQETP